jgi:hypothetical protein
LTGGLLLASFCCTQSMLGLKVASPGTLVGRLFLSMLLMIWLTCACLLLLSA